MGLGLTLMTGLGSLPILLLLWIVGTGVGVVWVAKQPVFAMRGIKVNAQSERDYARLAELMEKLCEPGRPWPGSAMRIERRRMHRMAASPSARVRVPSATSCSGITAPDVTYP